MTNSSSDLILLNGKITTLNKAQPDVSAIAIKDGKISAIGSDDNIMKLSDKNTQTIDLKQRRLIPGLNDSHLHLIRGGLNYNMELRWDGVQSLGHALEMLAMQVKRTPPPQWVRVVGGWSEFQFTEKRLPTLKEINTIAPDTLLITPPPNTISAKKLLLIGLGDRKDFKFETMRMIGVIGMREALRLGVASYSHASDLKDAGLSSPTADVAGYIIRGAIEAYRTQKYLLEKNASSPLTINKITLLAGPAYFEDSKDGIKKVLSTL